MKPYITLLLFVAFVSSCKKDEAPIEPVPQLTTPSNYSESVTLTTGSFMGIEIGQSVEEVYTTVQGLAASHNTPTVWIAAPTEGLEQLEENIQHYNNLNLGREATSEGSIQITFEDDIIKSLWVGDKHSKAWPSGIANQYVIKEGDNKSQLIAKLKHIITIAQHQPFFERISINSKKLNTAYDNIVAKAIQLTVVIPVVPAAAPQAKGYKVIMMNIENNRLKTIVHYEMWPAS